MTWRDNLRRASFREIEFFVDSHEGTFGRRVHVHEYPQRDKPYAEDMGRRTRDFTVEALVLGADYMDLRDQFISAAEARGPGKLVHPYLGELKCSLLECKLREGAGEGGVARFALRFMEAGDATFPTASTSPRLAVVKSAAALSFAVQGSFAARHKIARKPQFVADASQAIFGRALDTMKGAVGLVAGVAGEVAALNRGADAMRRDLITLLYVPASAAQALVGNVQQLVRNVTQLPREAYSLARTLYTFGSAFALVPTNTGSRRAQAINQAEIVQLVRAAAVAEGARAAAEVDFESYQDAVHTRDEMLATIDAMVDANPDDGTYDALRSLRAAIVMDIASRGADLARLVQWTPTVTMPALAIAQRLYSDATREAEVVTRNRVRHPLFVAGGQALEVVSDAAQ